MSLSWYVMLIMVLAALFIWLLNWHQDNKKVALGVSDCRGVAVSLHNPKTELTMVKNSDSYLYVVDNQTTGKTLYYCDENRVVWF